MNKRKIPKTLIKKDGNMSPEMEYNMLHAMEMIMVAGEYLLENDPKTPEEGLEYIKLGNALIALSDYQINPESKLGILFRQVNDLMASRIQKKIDKFENKSKKSLESNLMEEEIHLSVEELEEELKK